jgi:aspartate carbamoyltransferase catalytic subunit
MLRVQKERMHDLSHLNLNEYSRHFGLTRTMLEQHSDLIVLHPGPANYGMEIQEGIMNNPRVLIREQVNNGLHIRMAVLSSLITNHSLQER